MKANDSNAILEILKVIRHEGFVNDKTFKHDIALVKTKQPIRMDIRRNINCISLPSKSQIIPKQVVMSGMLIKNRLQKDVLDVADKDVCAMVVPDFNRGFEFCMASNLKGNCNG